MHRHRPGLPLPSAAVSVVSIVSNAQARRCV